MNESFIHYLWQHQYFRREGLDTHRGEAIQVFNPGKLNRNAGPDFLEAKIKIGPIDWAGSVEIHIKSSDYNSHQHQNNPAYNNVVLHVVWQHDQEVQREDGTLIPTLELRTRVDETLIKEYRKLIHSSFQIPCSNSFSRIKPLTVISMIEQAAIQRLRTKATIIQQQYKDNKGDWEETFYQVLAKNFGFKINAEPFGALAKAVPLRVIRKNSDIQKTEALLFGMAGFLDVKKGDNYFLTLQKEFDFLVHKFNLTDRKMNKAQWKFLRLRPANFPTLRMAQLACVLSNTMPLFEKILNEQELPGIKKIFSIQASPYWQVHYSFGKESNKGYGNLGEESIDNILINSVVPMMAAYAQERNEGMFFERTLEFLQKIKPESNTILRSWQSLGVKATNAFDSQGFIEQMNEGCKKRNCLNCSVGNYLLKPA